MTSDDHTVYSLRHSFQDRTENAGCSDRMQASVPLAAMQSATRLQVASTMPLSAVAKWAGGAPVQILNTADTPIAVSTAFRLALRAAAEH
ncbi:hypothetical protein EHS39_36600 [Ensifer sp. MPMI2T]|nr:hypothetical protein EHS39_36600 [Ensifer sp. MPMI2T]